MVGQMPPSALTPRGHVKMNSGESTRMPLTNTYTMIAPSTVTVIPAATHSTPTAMLLAVRLSTASPSTSREPY